MVDKRTLDELMGAGAGLPATAEVERAYRRAFAEFRAVALWSSREVEKPTMAAALAITESLRVEGNRAARRLAEQIERACLAVL